MRPLIGNRFIAWCAHRQASVFGKVVVLLTKAHAGVDAPVGSPQVLPASSCRVVLPPKIALGAVLALVVTEGLQIDLASAKSPQSERYSCLAQMALSLLPDAIGVSL